MWWRQVAVFPPAIFLPIVQELVFGTSVKVGVQDIHHEAKGAYTGSISASMAASLGVEYVLCGHSERRSLFGDTDQVRVSPHGLRGTGHRTRSEQACELPFLGLISVVTPFRR